MPYAEQAHHVPFNRTYWVVPGKLLAGCYPGALAPDEAQRKLRGLLEHGIRRVINLMEPDEIDMYARPFVGYEEPMKAIAESMGIRVYFNRMPVVDMSVPTIKEMKGILDLIDKGIEDDQSVYLHCLGGIGRTGTVVGCFLIRHGIAGRQGVLSCIQELRQTTEDRHRRSPETEEQRDMVLTWEKGT